MQQSDYNDFEEQLEVKKQEYKELEKYMDNLIVQNRQATTDLMKMEQQNEKLLQQLSQQQEAVTKTNKMAQDRIQMVFALEAEKGDLED